MFEPTLVEVPVRRPLQDYRRRRRPDPRPGQEGACTGFGLAHGRPLPAAHAARWCPIANEVSPRMLYDMARRYDEWPGEKYDGSSARGAMKGWHKHGVCSSASLAVHRASRTQPLLRGALRGRAAAAARRLLPRESQGHRRDARGDRRGGHPLRHRAGARGLGQRRRRRASSTGPTTRRSWAATPSRSSPTTSAASGSRTRGDADWGFHGFCQITYDDWLANGSDVWVARLGAPIELRARESVAARHRRGRAGYAQLHVLRPAPAHHQPGQQRAASHRRHLRHVRTTDVAEIFAHIAEQPAGRRRLLLYAHGGLTAEDSADSAGGRPAQPAARRRRLSALAHLEDRLLDDADATSCRTRCRDGGPKASSTRPRTSCSIGWTMRWSRWRASIGGKAQWSEMKENATLAQRRRAGASVLDAGSPTLKAQVSRRSKSIWSATAPARSSSAACWRR